MPIQTVSAVSAKTLTVFLFPAYHIYAILKHPSPYLVSIFSKSYTSILNSVISLTQPYHYYFNIMLIPDVHAHMYHR